MWKEEKMLVTSIFSFSTLFSKDLSLANDKVSVCHNFKALNFVYGKLKVFLEGSKYLNLYQKDKILEWSKLKAFLDDKINVTEKMKFVLVGVENISRKEKMLVTSIFSFPTMFSEGFLYKVVKSRDCVVKS